MVDAWQQRFETLARSILYTSACHFLRCAAVGTKLLVAVLATATAILAMMESVSEGWLIFAMVTTAVFTLLLTIADTEGVRAELGATATELERISLALKRVFDKLPRAHNDDVEMATLRERIRQLAETELRLNARWRGACLIQWWGSWNGWEKAQQKAKRLMQESYAEDDETPRDEE